MSIRTSIALLTALAVLVPGAALAQSPAAARPTASSSTKTADYLERNVGGEQVVTFTGDELPADPGGAYGGTIRPLPGAIRVGLIRPRMNFVVELLKSVENL